MKPFFCLRGVCQVGRFVNPDNSAFQVALKNVVK